MQSVHRAGITLHCSDMLVSKMSSTWIPSLDYEREREDEGWSEDNKQDSDCREAAVSIETSKTEGQIKKQFAEKLSRT